MTEFCSTKTPDKNAVVSTIANVTGDGKHCIEIVNNEPLYLGLAESLSVPSDCNMLCETENLNFNYLQEESFSSDVGKWKMSDGLREYFLSKGVYWLSAHG
ncbi:hypothetical protein LOD99_6704 [Oopsacas minuta]|uniref:Uncharacterized protein n=1 Tax=Oopsacas minuta TaxID=111878 RepID=A0AAV7JLH1_9METZ|nr:hypothetical protein LOD99_6704 [Oopsacas minuta]